MLESDEIGNSQKKPEKQEQHYTRIKLLGQGAFGKAFLVESKKDGNKWVMKQINISDMTQQERDQTTREAKILEALNHPNIVKFKQVYRTVKMKLNIVMQYADGGDLSGRIAARKLTNKFFDQGQILSWFTQICLAIKHVHDRKIIHRDIKGQNIFLTSQNIVKLGDFGIARVLHRTLQKARTVVGTPYYLSPEIIENKPYSLASDIWSLGVLLYQMCALTPPFTGNSIQFLALKIVKGSYSNIPNQYSYELKNLVKWMLNTNPLKRPTIHQILNSNLLINRIKNFLTESQKYTEFSHTVLHNQNIFKPKFEKLVNQKIQLNAPPNLTKLNSQNLVKQDKHSDQNFFNKNLNNNSNLNINQQQIIKTPPIPQKTPPIMHKASKNGIYRPPSNNHPVRPLINEKPDLGDLINIISPPLIQKPPIAKIITPQQPKKRPSTPSNPDLNNNLILQIIKDVKLVEQRDFKKKPPAAKSEQKFEKIAIKKNVSQEKQRKQGQLIKKTQNIIKVPQSQQQWFNKKENNKNINLAIQKKQKQKKGNIIKPIIKKVPTNQDNGYNQLNNNQIIKPIANKIQKKQIKKQIKTNKQQKKIKQQKQLIKPQKALEIKSQEIKKQQKQEKQRNKIKRQQERKKMKQDIKKKKNIKKLEIENKQKQKQTTDNQIVEQEKFEPFEQEKYQIQQFQNQHSKFSDNIQNPTESIKQEINYYNQPFQPYNQVQQFQQNQMNQQDQPIQNSALFMEFNNQPNQQNYNHSIYQNKQSSIDKEQQKPSPQFFKMISQMQSIIRMVDNVNQIVENIPYKAEKQLKFEDTLPADREDDLQSLCNVELDYTSTNTLMGLNCFGDHSKLQDLRILLEDVFGLDNFISLYRIIQKEVANDGINFEQSEIISKINRQIIDLDQQNLKKYFPLVVTIVALENHINQ